MPAKIELPLSVEEYDNTVDLSVLDSFRNKLSDMLESWNDALC